MTYTDFTTYYSSNSIRNYPYERIPYNGKTLSEEVLTGIGFNYDSATAKKVLADIESGREGDLIFLDPFKGRIDLYLARKFITDTQNNCDLYYAEYIARDGLRYIAHNTLYLAKYVDWLGCEYDDEESLRDEFDAVAFFGLGSNDNYGIIEHEDIS